MNDQASVSRARAQHTWWVKRLDGDPKGAGQRLGVGKSLNLSAQRARGSFVRGGCRQIGVCSQIKGIGIGISAEECKKSGCAVGRVHEFECFGGYRRWRSHEWRQPRRSG